MDFLDNFVMFLCKTYGIGPSESRLICWKAMDFIKEEVDKLKDIPIEYFESGGK